MFLEGLNNPRRKLGEKNILRQQSGIKMIENISEGERVTKRTAGRLSAIPAFPRNVRKQAVTGALSF